MNVVLEQLVAALDVRPVGDLLSHEQTIPENVARLQRITLESGLLADPLVVDRDTNVVLDGNHRLQVMQRLGCALAACQPVDYRDPAIRVGTWLPATDQPLERVLDGTTLRYERADAAQAAAAVRTRNLPFAALRRDRPTGTVIAALLEPGTYDCDGMVAAQERILAAFAATPWEYIADEHADAYLERGYTVLLRRPFSKTEITRRARARAPFPPKSTRHLLPERIIRLNARLEWLRGEPNAALQHIREMLSTRVYDGSVRRYSEPVTVIY